MASVKIVAISDQHGWKPEIPECDLLIVAGDLGLDVFGGVPAKVDPGRQKSWMIRHWLPWRYKQPAIDCVATWGNHDFCGELQKKPVDTVFEDGRNTDFVIDGLIERQGLKIWCSPWSNPFMDWAFMKSPAELMKVYDQIPEGIDILVSHQPPSGTNTVILDFKEGWIEVGSHELRYTINRVKPKLVICGHIHVARGYYEVEGVPVYNVSVVNEAYDLVHKPVELTL